MQQFIERFECALSKDKHFCRCEIVFLPCSHVACQNCVPNIVNNRKLKCQTCNQLFDANFSSENSANEFKNDFKANLKNLFLLTETKIDSTFKKLVESLNSLTENVDIQARYVKEEIEIRIESLKNEIDKIYENLTNNVDNLKNTILESIKVNLQSIQVEEHLTRFEVNLKKLKNDIENDLDQNEKNFFQFQDQLIIMNQLCQKINNINWRMKFDVAKDLKSEKLVGKIKILNHNAINNDELRNRLAKSSFETIIYDVMPFDICSLPNDTIACCNYHNIKIYDETFQLIKTLDTIDDKMFRSRGLTTNNRDLVYITDLQEHKILVCDLKFIKINFFGEYGSEIGKFSSPKGIYHHQKFLYVCDFDNKRIQKISDDFKSVECFKLKINPYYVKIIGNTACVCGYLQSWDLSNLSFYDTDSFSLILEYINQKGPISSINSMFYHCDFERKKLCCYNQDGLLVDEIIFERFNNGYGNDWTGIIVEFNNDLIITAQSNGKVLKLS